MSNWNFDRIRIVGNRCWVWWSRKKNYRAHLWVRGTTRPKKDLQGGWQRGRRRRRRGVKQSRFGDDGDDDHDEDVRVPACARTLLHAACVSLLLVVLVLALSRRCTESGFRTGTAAGAGALVHSSTMSPGARLLILEFTLCLSPHFY